MQPLSQVVFLVQRRERDGVLLVVFVNKVLYNGTRFPEVEAGVRVVDSRTAAIGVYGKVLGLLALSEVGRLELVGDVQDLEDDGHLDRVGCGVDAVENQRLDVSGSHCQRRCIEVHCLSIVTWKENGLNGLELDARVQHAVLFIQYMPQKLAAPPFPQRPASRLPTAALHGQTCDWILCDHPYD